MKVDEARRDYLLAKEIQGVSPRTHEAYSAETLRFSLWLDGQGIADIEGVDSSIIRLYINGLTGCNNVTKGIKIKLLRTWFNWMAADGIIQENPMDNVPNPKTPDVFPYILNEDELRGLLNTTKDKPRNHAVICLMLDTGIRATELCNLEMDEIDLGSRSLTIKGGKGGKDRTVYFSATTERAIRRYLRQRPSCAKDDTLFLSWKTGLRLDRNALGRMIKRAGYRAGINSSRRVSPHTLRHCFATQYIKNGGDSHSLARILGHTTTRIAEKYVNLVSGDIKEIYKRCSPMDKLGR